MLRKDLVGAIRNLGRLHVYGGLGFGAFADVPGTSYRGFRTYEELPSVYASTKININHHNSPLSYGYLNQRDTAITGSGGFMLTDYVEGMEETFQIGKEIDTWETLENSFSSLVQRRRRPWRRCHFSGSAIQNPSLSLTTVPNQPFSSSQPHL